MEERNPFQMTFFQALASLQEECVCAARNQTRSRSPEEALYELSAGVILGILEIIDGYADTGLGRLDVICEKTGEHLKANPFVELHDAACAYLKGMGEP